MHHEQHSLSLVGHFLLEPKNIPSNPIFIKIKE
jgi:hypothetical protein